MLNRITILGDTTNSVRKSRITEYEISLGTQITNSVIDSAVGIYKDTIISHIELYVNKIQVTEYGSNSFLISSEREDIDEVKHEIQREFDMQTKRLFLGEFMQLKFD